MKMLMLMKSTLARPWAWRGRAHSRSRDQPSQVHQVQSGGRGRPVGQDERQGRIRFPEAAARTGTRSFFNIRQSDFKVYPRSDCLVLGCKIVMN